MESPKLQKAIINEAGTESILTYYEVLNSKIVSKDYLTVAVNGSSVSISSLEVIVSTVELTLSSKRNQGNFFKIIYSNPSNNNDKNVIKNSTCDNATSLINRGLKK